MATEVVQAVSVRAPPGAYGLAPTAGVASATATATTADLAKFGLLLVELVGLACVVSRYHLEGEAFFNLFALATVGFAIQYFLPLTYRSGFFLLLSLLGIVMIMGLEPGLWLIALGVGLLTIVHLPLPMSIRIALVCAAGVGLAILRADWAPAPWSAAVWPILGSMFMFRLIVYVYDLKFGQAPESWAQRLSYFFMLPNVCFPLFPVVDSRAYARSWYDGERHETHQRGIEWILRGLVQLILYRLVYQRLAIASYDVVNVVDLIHYFLWLFLLYLRVSGQFHVIVGMLLLFGFNLPETHHLYYFASSFTDFWRRINIYWKDFMMKVFYYPMFFRTRRWSPTASLVVSTMWVFTLTWALHAYQLFWIRGTYQFTWNDILFWAILFVLVTINALWEARHGRRRVLGTARRSWRDRAVVAAKTLATFTVICILWGFWSSESLSEWFSLWPATLTMPSVDQARTAVIVASAVLAMLAIFAAWKAWFSARVEGSLFARGTVVLAQLFLLNLISISAVHSLFGAAGDLVLTARYAGGLNRGDRERQERGYYEDLLLVDRVNGELAELYMNRPVDWEDPAQHKGQIASTVGLRYELQPNEEWECLGAIIRTNQWGMHDHEYSLGKPTGCYRIALLGASHVMGLGVERDKTFEAVLERRLNLASPSPRFQKFEVMNFGISGYYPFEQILVAEHKAARFSPDAIMFVGHPGDARRIVTAISWQMQSGGSIAEPYLLDVMRRAGVNAGTHPRLIHQWLQPYKSDMMSAVYSRIVSICSRKQFHPVYVSLPLLNEN